MFCRNKTKKYQLIMFIGALSLFKGLRTFSVGTLLKYQSACRESLFSHVYFILCVLGTIQLIIDIIHPFYNNICRHN